MIMTEVDNKKIRQRINLIHHLICHKKMNKKYNKSDKIRNNKQRPKNKKSREQITIRNIINMIIV